MRIGILICVNRNSGGVYQYTYSVLNALYEWDTNNEFVVFTPGDSPLQSDIRDRASWQVEAIDPAIMHTVNAKQYLSGDGLDMACSGINVKAREFFKKHRIDLMIYTVPTPYSFECGIPYIMAIHDLQHRLQPEFPEVSAGDTWDAREYMFRNAVRHAQAILVDSQVGKEDVLNFYGEHIRPEKVVPLPFLPFYNADRKGIEAKASDVQKKYQLPDKYVLYPAQFWLHKNHSRLVHAIHILRFTHKVDAPLVLVGSGSDFGENGEARGLVFQNAMLLAEQLAVKDLIHHLGYVSDEDMLALYSKAMMLAMPTFFGPTNIPVLEAWSFGCPVISSDIRGIREQIGDAGLLADPKDSNAIAECILKLCRDDNLRNSLVKAGYKKITSYAPDDFARKLYATIENVRDTMPPKSQENACPSIQEVTGIHACKSVETCATEKDEYSKSKSRLAIATSIAPQNLEKQINAIATWIKLGFRVVSINCIEEIDVLRQSFPDVEFVPAERDAREVFGKPLIYFDDFLEYFRKTNCEFCGIVNSDVLLLGDAGIVSYIQSEARGSMVYGSRTDVESLEHLDGEVYEQGFDFFFFDRSLISCFARSEFCLGMPWWDYWAPLMPMLAGFQVKRLASPLAYHIQHKVEWGKENWLLFAKKFFVHLRGRMYAEMISNSQSLWAALGRTYSTHHRRDLKEKGMEYTSLMSFGLICPCAFEFLERHSQKIEYSGIQPTISQHSPATFRNDMDTPVGESDSTIQLHDGQQTECDVSIVLCTKDRAELLDAMLNSLEEAACGIVYELIVVEGGSSDDTLEVLRKHNVWRVYNESQHLGPGRHSWPELYNFGFSKARGKWAMYASDDITFGPNSIAQAVESLDKQAEEVAGGIFFYKNLHPTRQEWAQFGIDFTHGNKLLLNYGLIRLESFRKLGGLDEAYNFYCADTDFCYKLYESGCELIPLNGCFVTHDNLLDVQKQANADASARDIDLCQRRWRDFVPTAKPEPTRLLWRDDLAEAFDVPGDLERIDSGIESFWHGLAYFEQGMFAEAEREFMHAVKSQCDHPQVLWHLAMAAERCADYAIVEKAATGVIRLTPEFEPALELLLRATGRQQHSPEPVLCSAASISADTVDSHAGGYGIAEFHLDGQGWGSAEYTDQSPPIATMVGMPRRSGPDHNEMELRREIAKFNKVVVWGLKTSEHTHAYIHRYFFETLRKIGTKTVFLDDSSANADAVESNDLIIAVDVASSHIPVVDGAYYCLHNCPDHIHRRIAPARNIRLQTYMNSVDQTGEKWDEVTFFDSATRTLFQPWATDLLASEFKEPILNRSGGIVFWVGSVWDDALGRGNVSEIRLLKDVLEARDIRFVHLQGISDSLNIRYVRNSLIAPAIVGQWQKDRDYLPCRMWKNISYGQLGVSNVRKFDDVFDECTVKGRSIEELIDNTLSLPLGTYRDMIHRQQEIVKARHTYVNRLLNIIRAFESVKNH